MIDSFHVKHRLRRIVIFSILFIFLQIGFSLTIDQVDVSRFPFVSLTLSGEILVEQDLNIVEGDQVVSAPFLSFVSDYWVEEDSVVDIVFVVDVSFSMTDKIETVRNEVIQIVDDITQRKWDTRFGWISFSGSITEIFRENIVSIPESEKVFTKDANLFKNYIQKWDQESLFSEWIDEVQIPAVEKALSFPFRKGALSLIVLITDEDTQDASVTNHEAHDRILSRFDPKKAVISTFYAVYAPDSEYEMMAQLTQGFYEIFYPFPSSEVDYSISGTTLRYLEQRLISQSQQVRLTYLSSAFPGKTALIVRNTRDDSSQASELNIAFDLQPPVRISYLDTLSFPEIKVRFLGSPLLRKDQQVIFQDTQGDFIRDEAFRSLRFELPKNVDVDSLKLDIVWVFDVANSSLTAIQDVKSLAQRLVDVSRENKISLRLGIVFVFADSLGFQDLTQDTELIMALLNQNLTLKDQNHPQQILSGLLQALNFHYRAEAQKIVLLVSDAQATNFETLLAQDQGYLRPVLYSAWEKQASLFFIAPYSPLLGYLYQRVPGAFQINTGVRTLDSMTFMLESLLKSQQEIVYQGSDVDQRTSQGIRLLEAVEGDTQKRLGFTLFRMPRTFDWRFLQIQTVTASPFIVVPEQETLLQCLAFPTQGVQYEWICEEGAFVQGKNASRVLWKAPAQQGDYTIQITVSRGAIKISGEVVVRVRISE